MSEAATTETASDVGGPLSVSVEALEKLGKGSRRDGRHWLLTWIRNETHARPISGPTARPANVRIANEADEVALLHLMLLDVKENALPIAEASPDKVLEHIQMGTRRKLGILGVIDGPDGKPVASVLLAPFQWWWSRAYFLQEVWAFVHPDFRKSRHAEDLMKFAKWAADSWSMDYGYRVFLFQGVTTITGAPRKVSFYSRFTNYCGGFFIYPAVVVRK
jgi:hypothetical protein